MIIGLIEINFETNTIIISFNTIYIAQSRSLYHFRQDIISLDQADVIGFGAHQSWWDYKSESSGIKMIPLCSITI